MKKILIILSVAVLSAVAGTECRAQKFSVGVNAADVLYYGTANVEASVAVAKHVTLTAKGRYNGWDWGHSDVETEIHRKQRTLEAGARWWPWHVYSGWWFGAQGRYQEYNRNGLFISRDDLTEEGDAVGGGISAGYTLMLRPNLNAEFGFGMWAGRTKYRSYDCPTCGMPVKEGEKTFILPNEAILSLVYVF